MNNLIELLKKIVTEDEYAQWLRYVYLSALGYGLSSDSLIEHYEDHAKEELEHAEKITRWIVDLGGMPSTEVSPIEQFMGTAEDAAAWLLEAEIKSIDDYTMAHELAGELNLIGLQRDIAEIISVEHEHASDLGNYVTPHMLSGDDITMVVVAGAFRRFASKTPELFFEIIFNKTAVFDADSYIRDSLQTKLMYLLDDYTPQRGREELLKKIVNLVNDLWEKRQTENVMPGLNFFKSIYEWLMSDDVVSNWDKIHDTVYLPGWQKWVSGDSNNVPEWMNADESEELSEEPPKKEISAPESAVPRRPIETAIEEQTSKVQVLDAVNKGKKVDVGVGDVIFNSSQGKDLKNQGISASEANKLSTGKIVSLTNDSVTVDVDGDIQTWYLESDKIYNSRAEGQRLVL